MTPAEMFSRMRDEYPPGCMKPETAWNGSEFVAGLCCLANPLVAIEIGCCTGATTAKLALAMKQLGRGQLIGWEPKDSYVGATRRACEIVWPRGAWEIVQEKFPEGYGGEEIGFAYIDHEPKSAYLEAYEAIRWAPNAVLVAHDLTYQEGKEHVEVLRDKLLFDLWGVLGFPQERGFLVATRQVG